jgi:alpha-glucosidase
VEPLTAASFVAQHEDGASFALPSDWSCRLYILEDGLVRVLFTPPGGLREPRTWSIVGTDADVPWPGRDRLDVTGFARPPFKLSKEGGEVVLSTTALRVAARMKPFGFTWSLANGTPIATDRPTQAYQWSRTSRFARHYMARRRGDRYFGLGDKTGPLDKHGRRLRTLALDALGYDAQTSDPLYKHWPYLMVREPGRGVAYGLFYDTLAAATFDLGCEHDNYHGFYRYCEIEDGDLDYYFILGPGVRDVVRKFAGLTGPMAFGPRWSLGYANTAMSLADAPDAQVRLSRFIDDATRHDVPISAFHFGSGYSSIGKRRYVFTWNEGKFPDPRALVDKFARAGMRLVANIKPCLLDDHPAYREVAAARAFVNHAGNGEPCVGQFWDGQGAHVDFTHPSGIEWWQRSLERQLLALGILGWNDNNEYEIWDQDGESHGFGTPIPIARSRPLHALLMTRATFEAQAKHDTGERVFTVTRAGPPGIQRYAQTWSGDNTTSWETLRWNIRMGLSMSLSGMFNTGHDVGGFHGPVPDPELLVRWVQSGTFSPRFIMNSWKDGGEVNTPWLHPRVLPIIRNWIRLRYRLLPYLYTLYSHAARSGEPMLRPRFYDFPDDPRAFDDNDDFLLGPNLLVASVVEPGQRERPVYLPKGPGEWIDFWAGTYHGAGTVVSAAAPLERIPLFVPAGAILPVTDTPEMRHKHDEPSRAVLVFPGRGRGEREFAIYEDDGHTHRYRDGDYAELQCRLEWSATSVQLHVTKRGRFRLPYSALRVVAPEGERRTLRLNGDGVSLVPHGR